MAKRKSIGIGKGFYYYYDTLSPMESFYAKGKKKISRPFIDNMINSLIGKGMLKRTKKKGKSFIEITPLGLAESRRARMR